MRASTLIAIPFLLAATAIVTTMMPTPVRAGDAPNLIFRESTTWHALTPNDKLATYAVDDPEVEGVACYYTSAREGRHRRRPSGWRRRVSDISLACRQVGPIKIKDKLAQGDVMFSEKRSFFFKHMQIVRGCDPQRKHARLYGLFGQVRGRLAQELHLRGADHALGRVRRPRKVQRPVQELKSPPINRRSGSRCPRQRRPRRRLVLHLRCCSP